MRARKTGSSDMAEVTDLIKNLIGKYDMKAMLNYMAKLVNPEAEEIISVVARDIMGRAYQREIAAKPRETPLSSLSAVGGGWFKKEMEKANRQKKGKNTSSCKSTQGSHLGCNRHEAMTYCKKKGSRLPNINQLKRIYNTECIGRNAKRCGGWYWSSESTESNYAKYMDFGNGFAGSARPKSSSISFFRVRCVK